MSSEEQVRDSPHSVEFSVTSKGLWSGKVKAYADSPKKAMGEALIIAEKIALICKARNNIQFKLGVAGQDGRKESDERA